MRRTHSAGSPGISPFFTLALIGLAILFLGGPGHVSAQTVYPPESGKKQPPPRAHVIDDARLFSSEPGRLAALENRLATVEQQYGFPIYLNIYDTLISSNATNRAQELQDAWIGIDHPGLVTVFETDGGSFGMGVHPLKEFKVSTGSQIPDPGKLDLSQTEQDAVYREVYRRLGSAQGSKARVEAIVNALADDVSRHMDLRQQPSSGAARLRTIAFIVGMAAATGLLVLLVLSWRRKSERRERQRYIFPDVNVGMRLGAPYGGGEVRSRDFDEPPVPRI